MDELEGDQMRPDQIIEGAAAEMGGFSQEKGTLAWGGGTGEDANCPQVTKGCHRERKNLFCGSVGVGKEQEEDLRYKFHESIV